MITNNNNNIKKIKNLLKYQNNDNCTIDMGIFKLFLKFIFIDNFSSS